MIYLDHAATTPVPRAVADAMYEVLTEQFGNPSSQYPMGLEMKRRVEAWRKTVADALGCGAKQLFFTSCGTEADNWAVTAACWQNRHLGRHIVTTAVEHSAVLEACRWMERQGYEVTYLVPAQDGSLSAEQVLAAVRQDTALVSCMLVNNELGTLLPVAEAAQSIRDAGSPALLHCDAVQAFLDGKTEDELSKEEAMTRALKRELKRLDQSLSTQWMALEGTRLNDYFAYGPEGGETP